ncbi:hypothetical protein E4T42_09141 [Aureobasidium subglaciale]|nr:hypothetical protein E4T42_09141 [Aureobasidium subglaciale]
MYSASNQEQQSRSSGAGDELFVPHSPAAVSPGTAASAIFDGVETSLNDLQQHIDELKQYVRKLERDKRRLRAILVANHDSAWLEQQTRNAEARDVSPQWKPKWQLGTNRRSAPQISQPFSQGKKRPSESDASTVPTKSRRVREPSLPSGLGSSILSGQTSSSTTSPAISPSSTRKQQIILPPIIRSSLSRPRPQLNNTGAPAFHPNVQPSANRQVEGETEDQGT